MEVSNQGLGPAVIRGVRFFVDRDTDETNSASLIENDTGSWSAAIDKRLLLKPFDPEFDRPNKGDAYRPGECICLLKVRKRGRAAREILSAFARTSFELDYASMLGDKDSLQTVVVDGLEIVSGVVPEAELREILAEDRARAAL